MSSDDEPYSTVTLHDGRALAYLAVGPADAPAVFHFHGHGSSRLEAVMLEDAANKHNLRVLAFDRPGIGRSDRRIGDPLLDFPADIAEAADQLGIARFAVQGMSAGGPYALACAQALPSRVSKVSLISAVPAPEIARRSGTHVRRLMWWVAATFPNYLKRRLEQFRPDGLDDEEMIRSRMQIVSRFLGGEDTRLMQIPAMVDVLARTMLETARQGQAANRAEIARLVRPWGFDVRALEVPVLLWHGEADRMMTIEPARAMARALKHCRATFYPEEGHFSVLVNRADEILAALVA
jgi:pimeloyl-ACP methyl ester carboxylesterase